MLFDSMIDSWTTSRKSQGQHARFHTELWNSRVSLVIQARHWEETYTGSAILKGVLSRLGELGRGRQYTLLLRHVAR